MALVACPACTREISSSARACPNCGHPNKQGADVTISKLLWIVAGLGGAAGAFFLLAALSAQAAPGQAAAAGLACGAAVVPYVLARAWDHLAGLV
jgi:hypothetical protein